MLCAISVNAQPPNELKGKWIGDIYLEIAGKTIIGNASINIGNILAKTPNEIEIEFSNFDVEGIPKTYKWQQAYFKGSGQTAEFDFPIKLPIERNIECEGTFQIQKLTYGDIPFLYGNFIIKDQKFEGRSVSVILFEKSYVKNLAKDKKRVLLPDVHAIIESHLAKNSGNTKTTISQNVGITNQSVTNAEITEPNNYESILPDHSDISILYDASILEKNTPACQWDTTLKYYQITLGVLFDLAIYRSLAVKSLSAVPMNIFPTAYFHTTFSELRRIQQGKFKYPVDKMKQMLAFYEAYKKNRIEWENTGKCYDDYWNEHFEKTQHFTPIALYLLMEIGDVAVNAHVNYDLPRAIRYAADGAYPNKLTRAEYRSQRFDEFNSTDDIFYSSAMLARKDIISKYIDKLGELLSETDVIKGVSNVMKTRKIAWAKGLSEEPLLDLGSKIQRAQPVSYVNDFYEMGRKMCPGKSSSDKMSDGAALLFKGTKSSFSNREKNQIFTKFSKVLSSGGEPALLADLRKGKDSEYSIWIYPLDLNKDGVEEIFISYGYTEDIGMARAAMNLVAYFKNDNCEFEKNFDFSSPLPEVIISKDHKFPQLIISAGSFIPDHGMDNAVYSWYNGRYQKTGDLSDAKVKNMPKILIDELSRQYQSSLK